MAQTLDQLLSWGKETLKNAGIEDYNISAELLLRSVLHLTRAQFILKLRENAPRVLANIYKILIDKRARHVPLQHLIGWVDFYNIELRIDKRALIPRPETEVLVETVINMLKSAQTPRILDIGTGSGNIAIALAKAFPGAHLTGVDISSDALDLARSNAELNRVKHQITFILGNILDIYLTQTLGLFDCVVSNPPYIGLAEKGSLQPEVAEHDPAAAIFAGADALIFYKTIVANISYILKSGGLLAFEMGLGQAEAVADLMKPAFKDITITKDLAGIERVITGVYAGSDTR